MNMRRHWSRAKLRLEKSGGKKMKYKIHYTLGGYYEDSYILSGDTIKEIKKLNNAEMNKRGLDKHKNGCWSEELED